MITHVRNVKDTYIYNHINYCVILRKMTLKNEKNIDFQKQFDT